MSDPCRRTLYKEGTVRSADKVLIVRGFWREGIKARQTVARMIIVGEESHKSPGEQGSCFVNHWHDRQKTRRYTDLDIYIWKM